LRAKGSSGGAPGPAVEWWSRRRWSRRYAGQMNLIVEGDDHAGYRGGA